MVCKKFPRVKVITSEIDEGIDEATFQVIPGELRSVIYTSHTESLQLEEQKPGSRFASSAA